VSTISIRTKLWATFAMALVLIMAMGLSGLWQLRAVNEVAQESREIWLPRVELAREMRNELSEHWLLATRRSQTTDFRQLAGIAKDMTATMAGLRQRLAEFPTRGATPLETQLLIEFRKLCDDYEFVLRTAFQEMETGEIGGARELLKTAGADAVQDALLKLDTLGENAKTAMRHSAERAAGVYALARLLTIMLILVAGAYAIGAIAWTAKNISTPILRISAAMQRLTVGDASVTMERDELRHDEIGVLAEAVAGYRDSLIRSRDLSDSAELERSRLQAAVNNMPVGLAMFDGSQRLITCNARYGEIYEIPTKLLVPGTHLRDIFNAWVGVAASTDANPDDAVARVTRFAETNDQTRQLIKLSNGRIVNVIRQRLNDGGWVATHEDVTERRRIEERIHHMARHDALTDLPNRTSFVEKLTEHLKGIDRGGNLAVFCLDLDRFKSVNDTLGHPAGDALLKQVAQRLQEATREADLVARFGGDEFSIVQPKCMHPSEATTLAERIIESLSQPYDLNGNQVVIGVSVGIAIAPGDGMTADALLKHGDMALYRAKADGRGTYRLFEQEMDARMHARRALELDLRQALLLDEFEVYYQPIVDLANGEVSGFEALLRWRHPKRGMVSPAEFIPLAEEIGLIVPIGASVLRKACIAAASWPEHIRIAVNISPVQFRNKNILSTVVDALAVSKLAARRLELEITEGVLLQETETTLTTLHQLRALGVRIAMDDFGTGYSSLSYLRSFPFDKIKIDRSFISNIATDDSSAAIIRAVTTLSTSMGIATTAEGVETADQLAHVRTEGCSEVQGYLFSAPKPESEVPAMLSKLRQQIKSAA
jgi:diguanylate cyclase (GGDEF)-like protein